MTPRRNALGWRELWPEGRPLRQARRPDLPCQEALLDDWHAALTGRGPHHLLAHAPTGLGKTSAALAPALAWLAEAPGRGQVLYLVNRITQHDNPLRELRAGLADRYRIHARRDLRVVDLIGRSQLCVAPDSRPLDDLCKQSREQASFDALPAPAASWLEVRDHLGKRACPYHTLQGLLAEADLVIADYWWLFSQRAYAGQLDRLLSTRALVAVIDEGHNLPLRVRAELDVELPLDPLARQVDQAPGTVRDALQTIVPCLAAADPEAGLAPSDLRPVGGRRVLEVALRTLSDPELAEPNPSPLEKVVRLLLQPDDAVVFSREPGADGDRLVGRLIDPTAVLSAGYDRLKASLTMSGTLAAPADDRGELAYQLPLFGLPLDHAHARKYASPFAASQRRWIYCPDTIGTLSRRHQHYPHYAAHLLRVGSATPGVTAVFFSSYDFLEQVRTCLPEDEQALVVQEERTDADSNDQPQGLDEYRQRLEERVQSHRRAYLFAVYQGRLAEGADFPNNLIRTVVCVSLPLERPQLFHQRLQQRLELVFASIAAGRGDDPREKAREYGLERLSLSLVLQACGRGIRQLADRCAFVLLDARYGPGRGGLDWRRFLDPAPYHSLEPGRSVETFHEPPAVQGQGGWDPALLAAGRRRQS